MEKGARFNLSQRTSLVVSVVAALAVAAPARRAFADDPKSADAAKTKQFLTTGQEPAEPFVPLVPRTVEDTTQLEALKSFCLGRWYENQNRWNDAVIAYRKALEHDPKSLAVIRALIDSCNAARRPQDALKYMQEAEDLAPEDFELLGRLGEALEELGDFDGAIKRYDRALASPRLPRRSPWTVILRLKLGGAKEVLRQYDDASQQYLSVMDALDHPDEYGFDMLPSQPPFLKNRAETYERFGNVFRQAKRYDDALRAFRQAQAVSPGSSRFSLNLAQVYLDQEKYEQSLEYLEKFVQERMPQGSQAYELLATALGKLGRGDEVLPRVKEAAAKDRFNMHLQYFLGTLYDEAGETDKAKEIYTTVLKNPPDTRVYKSLARIYQKEDRIRDLILLLGDGMEKQVPGRAGVFEATEEQAKVLGADPETARKVVEAAREIREAEPRRLRLGALFFVAKVAQTARQFDDAAEFFRFCVQERPQFPGLKRELALSLAFAGQHEEAVKLGEELVGLEPDNVDFQFALARIYEFAAQFEKAAEKYQTIIKAATDNDVAREMRYMLSNCYVRMGDMAKGEQVLLEVLEQFPDDATANNDLGYLWADEGKNLERSLAMIKKAVDKEPENPSYLDSLGWVLFKLSRAAEARKYLEKAAATDYGGQDATIVDHLGDVLQKLNESDKAREMWQKAADILDAAKGPRRDDKRLKEINQKLNPKKDGGEIKREQPDKTK